MVKSKFSKSLRFGGKTDFWKKSVGSEICCSGGDCAPDDDGEAHGAVGHVAASGPLPGARPRSAARRFSEDGGFIGEYLFLIFLGPFRVPFCRLRKKLIGFARPKRWSRTVTRRR